MTITKLKDRRKHQRYSMKDGAYASVNHPPSGKLGQIFNISFGGLSFTYIDNDISVVEIPNPLITLGGFGNYVKNIPFQAIDDFEIKGSSFSLMVMRRQCIQFSDLSDNQRSRLSEFIKNNSSYKNSSTNT